MEALQQRLRGCKRGGPLPSCYPHSALRLVLRAGSVRCRVHLGCAWPCANPPLPAAPGREASGTPTGSLTPSHSRREPPTGWHPKGTPAEGGQSLRVAPGRTGSGRPGVASPSLPAPCIDIEAKGLDIQVDKFRGATLKDPSTGTTSGTLSGSGGSARDEGRGASGSSRDESRGANLGTGSGSGSGYSSRVAVSVRDLGAWDRCVKRPSSKGWNRILGVGLERGAPVPLGRTAGAGGARGGGGGGGGGAGGSGTGGVGKQQRGGFGGVPGEGAGQRQQNGRRRRALRVLIDAVRPAPGLECEEFRYVSTAALLGSVHSRVYTGVLGVC